MSKEDVKLVRPTEGLKKGYGITKQHKTGIPVRPIVLSLNSVTCGAEEYLKSLVKPILEKCEFALDSTREFKKTIFSGQTEIWL